MDEAMKLIDDLTQTPRPWGVEKDPNKKKIVVGKEQLIVTILNVHKTPFECSQKSI